MRYVFTIWWGHGGSDPVAEMGSGVGPNQLSTNGFHYPQTLILPGTFKQQKKMLCALKTRTYNFISSAIM